MEDKKDKKIKSINFSTYSLVIESKVFNSAQTAVDMRLYNNGHYTGAYVLLIENDYYRFREKMLNVIDGKSEEDECIVDKNYWIKLKTSKKEFGECLIIQSVIIDKQEKRTPREIFFPLDKFNYDKFSI